MRTLPPFPTFSWRPFPMAMPRPIAWFARGASVRRLPSRPNPTGILVRRSVSSTRREAPSSPARDSRSTPGRVPAWCEGWPTSCSTCTPGSTATSKCNRPTSSTRRAREERASCRRCRRTCISSSGTSSTSSRHPRCRSPTCTATKSSMSRCCRLPSRHTPLASVAKQGLTGRTRGG